MLQGEEAVSVAHDASNPNEAWAPFLPEEVRKNLRGEALQLLETGSAQDSSDDEDRDEAEGAAPLLALTSGLGHRSSGSASAVDQDGFMTGKSLEDRVFDAKFTELSAMYDFDQAEVNKPITFPEAIEILGPEKVAQIDRDVQYTWALSLEEKQKAASMILDAMPEIMVGHDESLSRVHTCLVGKGKQIQNKVLRSECIDVNEEYAGSAGVTVECVRRLMRVKAWDVKYSSKHNVLVRAGFRNMLLSRMFGKKGTQNLSAMLCTTWSLVCRHTMERSPGNPLGDTQRRDVREGSLQQIKDGSFCKYKLIVP